MYENGIRFGFCQNFHATIFGIVQLSNQNFTLSTYILTLECIPPFVLFARSIRNRLIFIFTYFFLTHFSKLIFFLLLKFKLLTLPMSIIQFTLFVISKSTIACFSYEIRSMRNDWLLFKKSIIFTLISTKTGKKKEMKMFFNAKMLKNLFDCEKKRTKIEGKHYDDHKDNWWIDTFRCVLANGKMPTHSFSVPRVMCL